MSISLCQTVLAFINPPPLRRGELEKTTLNKYKMILEVGKEAADAILNCRYKQFDALVKNFGCQMTAFEVFLLVVQKKEKLKVEAAKFLEKKQEKDLLVSKDFAKLVTFCLLSLVNDNKEENGKEIPFTNIEKLKAIQKRAGVELKEKVLSDMIAKIQRAESIKAALFIQEQASYLVERKELIEGMLRQVKLVNGISSIPLLYNTETVMRLFNGVLLLKNKLYLCEKPIEGRKSIQIFLKVPEGIFIEKESVENKSPLLVIEGDINDEAVLREKILKVGIIAICNANTAPLKQYVDKDLAISDETGLKDIQDFKDLNEKEKIMEIFEIDHFYVSTLEEEIGGNK